MAKTKKKQVKVKEPGANSIAKRKMMSQEEEQHENIRLGKKEEDVYDQHALEELEENDEISTWEEGFMEGAHSDGEGAKCRNCGKILMENVIEMEFHDEICRFCSENCVNKYGEKHGDEEEE